MVRVMDKITVLIVDDNQQWCEILKYELKKSTIFEVLKPLNNGHDALIQILSNRPDVLVLDILLPVYDGLYIINYIRDKMPAYHPFIYVISALGIDKSNQVIGGLGVDYYSIKPIKAAAVASNLFNLVENHKKIASVRFGVQKYDRIKSIDPTKYIEDYLFDIGAPLYRLSTNCGHMALRIGLLDESKLNNITSIYKVIAEQSDPVTSPGAIERNIRSMILNIRNKETAYFKECFPDGASKLVNSQFINTSVYILRRRIEEHFDDQIFIPEARELRYEER